MKIELEARFKKTKTLEDIAEEKEQIKVNKIIYGEDWEQSKDPMKEEFDYEPVCVDVKDIRIFNPVDESHTCLRTYFGDSWIIKARYLEFKEFYQKISKTPIYKYESI